MREGRKERGRDEKASERETGRRKATTSTPPGGKGQG